MSNKVDKSTQTDSVDIFTVRAPVRKNQKIKKLAEPKIDMMQYEKMTVEDEIVDKILKGKIVVSKNHISNVWLDQRITKKPTFKAINNTLVVDESNRIEELRAFMEENGFIDSFSQFEEIYVEVLENRSKYLDLFNKMIPGSTNSPYVAMAVMCVFMSKYLKPEISAFIMVYTFLLYYKISSQANLSQSPTELLSIHFNSETSTHNKQDIDRLLEQFYGETYLSFVDTSDLFQMIKSYIVENKIC